MSEGRTGTGGTSAPTVLRMILGRRLQERRQDAGASLEDAAKALRVTSLTIRRLEKAEVALKPLYVEKLLETYGADRQEIDEFVVLAERANEPGWWHTYRDVLPNWFSAYVSLEAGARTLRTYEPHYVTGLLQTHAYARGVLRGGFPNEADEDLGRRVDLRLRRQSLLDRPDAPTLWVVMEEAVLHRVVGGPEVMREQIERLLEVSELDHVSVDVVPFTAGAHVGACAPFTYFRFEEPELPDVVYTEVLTGAMYLDQRSDVAAHLEAHNRMSLLTSDADSKALLNRMRKEYS
ncbi:transcriptional regulator with XRE-family HTH domain [Streptomyces sp. SAI-208]|uniref:helix-turn-helix domain-containing protein n=1 Tax=unclassified Streptomyces TaxID=2593676 RepID=UPI002473D52D|nr:MULTISPECIES: helix-turn-helix transcriptional regulator [unclassified Streptomyces]MDH6521348.1 transcriptional regulator with XRE-family HTH domain [Streptomyces sp. SAI-090]MDH6553571.1 transcriptional regulator with XRE-family HTH domain [Streptomyces sp. SAI-041]MDH6572652.1 transcriptional regulator with XRE-family HTH domain [Streptomyces sp. SAI-117]MDH6582387.1 transcriptional regulator with XRE-family HTH domain [Streptomyces sp. SAI-133]MDH6612347.1 transcriptional regulator with